MNRSGAVLIAVALTFDAWNSMQAPASELKLKIINPAPETDGRFGTTLTAVGSSGNILVAAPASFVVGGSTGTVYLMDGHNGEFLQTYRSPSANPGNFGRAVAALTENDILIGGVDFDAAASGTLGRFYNFNATTGSLLKTFPPPNRRETTSFGQPIAAEGNGILVGASQSGIAGPSNSGAAYLLDAETGKQLQRFLPPSPTLFGFFGDSIALTGDNVIVGSAGGNTDEAYIFSASTGDLLHTIQAPDAGDDDFFGASVAADGNNVLVGAFWDDTAGLDTGAAYLFDATTGDLLQTFLDPTPEENDFFGGSLAIRGNKVLVGASQDDTLGLDNGAVYLFDATTGSLLDTFLRPTPVDIPPRGAGFGRDIAFLDDEHVIISDHLDNTGADRAGAVYVYETAVIPEPVGDCNGDSVLNAADLFCVSSVEARDVVLGDLNTLPGDLDGNGEVAIADFLVLAGNFGTDLPSYADGNIDLNNGIAFEDFLVLSGNFGETPSDVAAVPEPNGVAMIWLSLLYATASRRRAKRWRRKIGRAVKFLG